MTILIIGFDCLDYDLSLRYNLSFVERGQLRLLTSFYQATVPSWTSIYTGLLRHQHRITSGWKDWLYNRVPIVLTPGSSETPPIYPRKFDDLPFVWKDLNDLGYPTSLFGMPLTFPPLELDGWIVSGFPCLSDPKLISRPPRIALLLKNYPVDIMQTIDPKFVTHFRNMDIRQHKSFHRMGGYEVVKDHIMRRLANLIRVWTAYQTDVVFVGFSFLDHIGHLAIVDEKQQKLVYGFVDWAIERTIEIIEPEKTLIVSDHGGHVVKPFLQKGVEGFRYFDHNERAVIYVEGAELGDEERHENNVKKEILKLVR